MKKSILISAVLVFLVSNLFAQSFATIALKARAGKENHVGLAIGYQYKAFNPYVEATWGKRSLNGNTYTVPSLRIGADCSLFYLEKDVLSVFAGAYAGYTRVKAEKDESGKNYSRQMTIKSNALDLGAKLGLRADIGSFFIKGAAVLSYYHWNKPMFTSAKTSIQNQHVWGMDISLGYTF